MDKWSYCQQTKRSRVLRQEWGYWEGLAGTKLRSITSHLCSCSWEKSREPPEEEKNVVWGPVRSLVCRFYSYPHLLISLGDVRGLAHEEKVPRHWDVPTSPVEYSWQLEHLQDPSQSVFRANIMSYLSKWQQCIILQQCSKLTFSLCSPIVSNKFNNYPFLKVTR